MNTDKESGSASVSICVHPCASVVSLLLECMACEAANRVGLKQSPAQAPLRTVRESFPSHGSSLSMGTSQCGVPRLSKHAATNASHLIQPLPYLSTADLLGNPYAGSETHQSTGVDRHLLFSVGTVPSMF